MQKAVITGPTGAIGLALIRKLKQEGVKVTAIVRPGSPRNAQVEKIPDVNLAICDLKDLSSFEAKGRADVFYHLGWCGTSGAARNDMSLQLQNVQYTLDAVSLAEKLGCKRFIGVGSQAEYGRTQALLSEDTPCAPENGYGIAKLAAGQFSRLLSKELKMEHVWTRVLSVYGPGDADHTLIASLCKTLLSGEDFHCTKGEQIWDYIYSADAAEFLYRLGTAKQADGGTFCIGSGRPTELKDYMELAREAVFEQKGSAGRLILDRPYPEGQVMHLAADISKLTEVTGYRPETDFATGIREYLKSL
ncbi:MAG: NAD(P)-dependent oxidoreductase [Lachnospiraceae bacterium]|nr:NAD(P)-dependent oxidoreductase [Lachnospiraceae bacterium]